MVSLQEERQRAIERYTKGESVLSICTSLQRSKRWFYKWLKRYLSGDSDWHLDRSRQPHTCHNHTPFEVEEIVKFIRLNLYNEGVFCGSQAIMGEMEDLGIKPRPSLSTIDRILRRNSLAHKRTGSYEPKGVPYPKLPSDIPNQRHQADWAGPLYLHGPIRFYSLNVIDVGTGRCALQPSFCRSAQSVIDALIAAWSRLGVPQHLQVDNAMCFYGSPTHPRGMGPLIRLCLLCNVEPWFIPIREPWRNGVVEKFNDHFEQKFLKVVHIETKVQLFKETLSFEHKHNSRYRYSKLRGKTPLQAFMNNKTPLRFPNRKLKYKHPLKKQRKGKYHLIRFIRGDGKLDIFGETFKLAPELHYEYVVATIYVKEQKLKIYVNKNQVDEFNYKLT